MRSVFFVIFRLHFNGKKRCIFSHKHERARYLCVLKMAPSTSYSSSSSKRDDGGEDHRRRENNNNAALLVDCSWRVDVTLSSSQAKKVLRPTILMSLETTKSDDERFSSCGEEDDEEEENGITTTRKRRETFEMSLEMFQELRVSVAKILTEMEWANEEMKRT